MKIHFVSHKEQKTACGSVYVLPASRVNGSEDMDMVTCGRCLRIIDAAAKDGTRMIFTR